MIYETNYTAIQLVPSLASRRKNGYTDETNSQYIEKVSKIKNFLLGQKIISALKK